MATETRGAKVEVVCKCGCRQKFTARVADRKRGWGTFATKSCKAKWQENRTGQHTNALRDCEHDTAMADQELADSGY